MSKRIKNIALSLNVLIITFSTFWVIKTEFEYEPMIVFCGQLLSLLTLLFGENIESKFFVEDVSKSKVRIDVHKDDNSQYEVKKIRDNSEVNIHKK